MCVRVCVVYVCVTVLRLSNATVCVCLCESDRPTSLMSVVCIESQPYLQFLYFVFVFSQQHYELICLFPLNIFPQLLFTLL